MQKKKICQMMVDLIAETSYFDKTYAEAKKAIDKWMPLVKKSDMPEDDKQLLIYILGSRRENIAILQECFRNETRHRNKAANLPQGGSGRIKFKGSGAQ